MKWGTALIAATAVALAAPVQAKVLKPGQYSAGGLQDICLVSDGTWYSPTFANWGGQWFTETYQGENAVVFGNYNSGAGNDSMVINGTKLLWMEWSDDLTYSNPLGDLTFTKEKKNCDPPQPAGTRNKNKNPIE